MKGRNCMLYKIIGLLVVSAALVIGYMTVNSELEPSMKVSAVSGKVRLCKQLTPAEQLTQLIENDFSQLKTTNQLPTTWENIVSIEYRIESQLAKNLLGSKRPTFTRTQEGTHNLELQFMDLPDEENPGIIIQASLFESKTKNKIFEIGRTYRMSDLNYSDESYKKQTTPKSTPSVIDNAQEKEKPVKPHQ